MPAWTPHIKIARTINKKLNMEEDYFILGNVYPDILSGYIIPDISKKIKSDVTHYREKTGVHHIIIQDFINKHKGQFKNPVVLGYLCHLIADSFWNINIYSKHHKKQDGKVFMIINDGTEVETTEVGLRKLKHHEFDVFDDYLQSTNNLGEMIGKIEKTDYFKDLFEVPCTKEDIDKTVKHLNNLVNSKPQYKADYKLFTEIELNNLLEKTYSHILETLISKGIIDKNYKFI